MYPIFSRAYCEIYRGISVSNFSRLIDHCLSLKSFHFAKTIHAQLIKVGFNCHTFLGNRCLDLYSNLGADASHIIGVFDDITGKNSITWNIFLKCLVRCGELRKARNVFDEMPERDVVCWNTMISGYASHGFHGSALEVFLDMQNYGVRPSGYSCSILTSFVLSAYQGKQIHGYTMRNGLIMSNVVLGNSLINMYGELGLLSYGFGVFLSMEKHDVISWNSLIWSCHKNGSPGLALYQYYLMRSLGYFPDEFTMSSIFNVCSDLQDLMKGYQVLTFCVKMGLLVNTIVSSAAIDLFSECNRLEDSNSILLDVEHWDSAVCSSMISSYAGKGFAEASLDLFVLTLRENIHPTEFMLSSVVSVVSGLLPLMPGIQVHCLAVKLGFESEIIVASSLVNMYAKYGMIDSSILIFAKMEERDLLSWNTMIIGLAQNGKSLEALELFEEMLEHGPPADQVTLSGVLLACNFGGFTQQGIDIFLAMQEFGMLPRDEDHVCIIELMIQAGKLKEAIDIVDRMPYEPSSSIWESILGAFGADADLRLIEPISNRMMEAQPHSSMPYLVLARAYEIRGRWESMARIRKAMNKRGIKKVAACSWVGVKNQSFVFESDKLLHSGGHNVHLILRLLNWDMQDQGCIVDEHEIVHNI